MNTDTNTLNFAITETTLITNIRCSMQNCCDSVAAGRTGHVTWGGARGKWQNMLAVQCQASERLLREKEKGC